MKLSNFLNWNLGHFAGRFGPDLGEMMSAFKDINTLPHISREYCQRKFQSQ